MLKKMPSSDWITLGNERASLKTFQERTKKYISLLNSIMKKHKKDIKRKEKDYKEFKNGNDKLNKNKTQTDPLTEKILQNSENTYLKIIKDLNRKENKIELKLNKAYRLDSLFTEYIKNSNSNRLNEIKTLWDELNLEFFDGEHIFFEN